MEVRIDKLTKKLADNKLRSMILTLITSDPKVIGRTVSIEGVDEGGGPEYIPLTVYNAAKDLYTPQEEWQLYAKGIVIGPHSFYLPLIKIYNYGENPKVDTVTNALLLDHSVRRTITLKEDGTLIHRFVPNNPVEGIVANKVVLATRGVIEGSAEFDHGEGNCDFFSEARRIAEERYPALLDHTFLPHCSLTLELVGPGNMIITRYDEWDLVLHSVFDRRECRYWSYVEMKALSDRLNVVESLEVIGDDFQSQLNAIETYFAGTDKEGVVILFERDHEVLHRVKWKSHDYRLMLSILSGCSYKKVSEYLSRNPEINSWEAYKERFTTESGRKDLPEELLGKYAEYYSEYRSYLHNCEQIFLNVRGIVSPILTECTEYVLSITEEDLRKMADEGQDISDVRVQTFKKRFSEHAMRYPFKYLMFAARDGYLDLDMITSKAAKTREEALELLKQTTEYANFYNVI